MKWLLIISFYYGNTIGTPIDYVYSDKEACFQAAEELNRPADSAKRAMGVHVLAFCLPGGNNPKRGG